MNNEVRRCRARIGEYKLDYCMNEASMEVDGVPYCSIHGHKRLPKVEYYESSLYYKTPWVCQIRPADPFHRHEPLRPTEFFRPEKAKDIIIEDGIKVVFFNAPYKTLIVDNDYFCVVKKPFTPHMRTRRNMWGELREVPASDHKQLCVCLPENAKGREVVFISPTTPKDLARLVCPPVAKE